MRDSKLLKILVKIIFCNNKTRKYAIVEYLDYQLPVTLLKDQREMEINKQQT